MTEGRPGPGCGGLDLGAIEFLPLASHGRVLREIWHRRALDFLPELGTCEKPGVESRHKLFKRLRGTAQILNQNRTQRICTPVRVGFSATPSSG